MTTEKSASMSDGFEDYADKEYGPLKVTAHKAPIDLETCVCSEINSRNCPEHQNEGV